MGDDGSLRLCASSTTARHFFHRHLVLIDQLDHVDAGFGELRTFARRVVGAFHSPANILRCPDTVRAE